jgi:putative ABC transport system permease protein
VPFFQKSPEGEYAFAVRAAGPPDTLARLVRNEVHAIAPGMPVVGMTTFSRAIDERLANERLLAAVGGMFGVVALLLAGVGIYGIVAHAVARRTPELGLRMALGAGRRQVIWLVLRSTVTVMTIGIVLGLAIAIAASDTISSLLFGLPSTDPRVYAAAVAFLSLVGIAASIPPVLRAVHIDPMTTLRRE